MCKEGTHPNFMREFALEADSSTDFADTTMVSAITVQHMKKRVEDGLNHAQRVRTRYLRFEANGTAR
jgi:hypothetical protein